MALSERQYVEMFQLLFLQNFTKKVQKDLLVLKGGCNLRFFYKSIRYSEDIDFDVQIITKETLKKNVTKMLNSTPFGQIMLAKGIKITQTHEAKQTDTTQRWKLKLKAEGIAAELPTKIEFSRRGLDAGTIFGSVDSEVVQPYSLFPILMNHYKGETAFLQKIIALSDRRETEARDAFDLNFLLERGITCKKPVEISAPKLNQAIFNVESIHFDDFRGQVVTFLSTDYRDYYDSEHKWKEMQERVIRAIDEVRS